MFSRLAGEISQFEMLLITELTFKGIVRRFRVICPKRHFWSFNGKLIWEQMFILRGIWKYQDSPPFLSSPLHGDFGLMCLIGNMSAFQTNGMVKLVLLMFWDPTVSKKSWLGGDLEVECIWNLKDLRPVFSDYLFPDLFQHDLFHPHTHPPIHPSSLYQYWTGHWFKVMDLKRNTVKISSLLGALNFVAETAEGSIQES